MNNINKVKPANNYSAVDNLLLNMSAGLLPINLYEHEKELLKKEFGEDWFIVLGYTYPEYQKPK